MDKDTIKKMLESIKQESFVEPDYASDSEAMGQLIARYFEWNGLDILRAAASALEDANFHTEAVGVNALLERAIKDSVPC